MQPSDIAFLLTVGPVVAVWVCCGLWLCAIILRFAYEALKGDI